MRTISICPHYGFCQNIDGLSIERQVSTADTGDNKPFLVEKSMKPLLFVGFQTLDAKTREPVKQKLH
jgi:hypothetical protein